MPLKAPDNKMPLGLEVALNSCFESGWAYLFINYEVALSSLQLEKANPIWTKYLLDDWKIEKKSISTIS
ncbi:MAG: hypothetical protein HC912_01000 [Saprospiraceae bacterium]|nr:hypothetical protein [Saprospiraceae bacterium]